MSEYYYVSGNKGMTSSGSFTSDKNRWIKFTQNDVNSLAGRKPYGATKTGAFILVSKFW